MPIADNVTLIIATLLVLLVLYALACIYFGNDM
jgi:hypothetical protein